MSKLSKKDAEKVRKARATIEELTGKMVSLRSRAAYREAQKERQKAYRDRLKQSSPKPSLPA